MMEHVLASDDIGRDEQSTLGLLRKLDVCILLYISVLYVYSREVHTCKHISYVRMYDVYMYIHCMYL